MIANTVSIAVAGIRAPRWLPRLRRYLLDALRAVGARGWELSVLLCGDEQITTLNARYRHRRRPTDVLAFRQESERRALVKRVSPPRAVGDIVISVDTLRRNAAALGVPVGEELARLAVHGVLHLQGLDHAPGKGAAMLERQERLLARLGGIRLS